MVNDTSEAPETMIQALGTMVDDSQTLKEGLEAVGIDYTALGAQKKRQAANQHAFLRAYEFNGTETAAAKAVGITWEAVRLWKRDDSLSFNTRFPKAIEAFANGLEDIAMARIREPQGYRGSDVLLLAMLNAHKPEKYRTGIIVVDETPKAVAAKLAAMARDDKEERESAPAATRADNITAIEKMRESQA